MPKNGKLDARDRASALDRLAGTEFDVLVIGGGITGAGAALDAASRGLRVALVEARDLASGTSSRSSKLIHGGLRYLEMLDFGLVREALRERGLLLTRLAPHLVRPVRFLYPLQHRAWERVYAGSGVTLYDLLGSGVPTIAVAFDRIQLRTADALHERGAVLSAGLLDRLAPNALLGCCMEMLENRPLVQRLSEAGRMLVDGKGLSRVVEIVRRQIWLTSQVKTSTAC